MTSQNDIKTTNDIPSVIKYWSDTTPEKEVFVFFNENGRRNVLTARDVYVLAGRFASRLRAMGFQQGDVISNALPNSAERVVTDFGIIMSGCIAANCQIMSKDGSDFWMTANGCETSGVILPNNKSHPAYTVLQQYLHSQSQPKNSVFDVTIPEVPSLKQIILINRSHSNFNDTEYSFLDSLRFSSEEIFHDDISPDSIVYIFVTSGTTGFSKLSPRTHRAILATGRNYDNQPPSVRISQRPLGWGGGYPYGYLTNSTCIVIQDCFEGKTKLCPKYVWSIIETEGCTSGFMLPQEIEPFLDAFNDSPPEYKLKILVTGGQPMTKSVCAAIGVLTEYLIVTYASTEMGGVTNGFLTSPDDMEDFFAGKPFPGVDVKIVDINMKEVDTGKEGMVLIKSPFGCNHYYNQSVTKQTCTEDGYFISGDRGWFNQNGDLFVSDRHDDVIFQGSTLIYPSWPESVLCKISGVSEAVVMGIPGSDKGKGKEQLCACVVLKEGSSWTSDSLISSYNESFAVSKNDFFPRVLHVEFFNEFPRIQTGKINKRHLRELVLSRIAR